MDHVLKTSVAELKLLDDDFIRIEYAAGCHIDLWELEESMQAYRQLVGYSKFYLVTVMNADVTVSRRARNYWTTTKRSSIKIAEGFVIEDLAHRLLANFVMTFQPPKHNLRFFNSEKRAVAWINSIRRKKDKK